MKANYSRMFIILTFLVTIAASAFCQFTLIPLPQYPGPTSFENRLVDFGNPDHGFFSATVYFSPGSGEEYWFYMTDDGGMTWTKRFSGGSQWFQNYFLTAVNSDTCLIAYGHEMGDYLFRISGSGSVSFGYYNFSNWMEVPVNVSLFTDSIQFYSVNRYSTDKNTYSVLYKLEGDSMTEILQTNRDTLEILKSHFISQDIGFLITKNASNNTYSVLKTTDGCHSLQVSFTIDSLSITGIDFFNPSTGMISCSEGGLYKTNDGGQSWYPVSSGISEKINCLDFVNDQIGYYGGDNGKFFQTTDQGESWTGISFPSDRNIYKLKMFGYGQGYLMCDNGSCYRYTDNSSVALPQETVPALIYPNPTQDRIIIGFPASIAREAEISLVKLTGEVLFHAYHTENEVTINLSAFSKGIYILTIIRGNDRWMKKVIVY